MLSRSALPALLLLPALGSANILCTWSPPGCPDLTYDFTQLEQQTSTQDLVAEVSHGRVRLWPRSPKHAARSATERSVAQAGTNYYYLRVCAPPAETQKCPGSTVQQPSGIQVWSSQGSVCAAIGDLSTAKWSLTGTAAGGGASVSFTGGDGGRSSVIHFVCDPAALAPTIRSIVEGPQFHYTISLAAAGATWRQRPPPRARPCACPPRSRRRVPRRQLRRAAADRPLMGLHLPHLLLLRALRIHRRRSRLQ